MTTKKQHSSTELKQYIHVPSSKTAHKAARHRHIATEQTVGEIVDTAIAAFPVEGAPSKSRGAAVIATRSAGRLVSAGTLIARVNRKLACEGERVRTVRGVRWIHDLGGHYIIDTHTGSVVARHVNLETLARELAVLDRSEVLT